MDSIPKDLNRPWEDPMPEPGRAPHRAGAARHRYTQSAEMPEWKQQAMGKAVAFGFGHAQLPMAEQREIAAHLQAARRADPPRERQPGAWW